MKRLKNGVFSRVGACEFVTQVNEGRDKGEEVAGTVSVPPDAGSQGVITCT